MAFSVLMSVYSKENPDFFDQSLNSILINQILKPDEFVLICDGELTHHLEDVITKYQILFPDILKVYRKENGGLGKALNFGLPKCSYQLVARADSDDICTQDRFAKQVEFMSEHPEIGIISSHIDEFTDDWVNPIHKKTLPLNHKELVRMAKFRCPLNHMSVMMRKNLIIDLGSYRHVPFVEDYELWVRAIGNGIKIANIDDVLVHARIGNGMVKRRSTKKYIKSWHYLNKEMLGFKMIGYATYLRNMLSITAFVFMPEEVKEFLYKYILRK